MNLTEAAHARLVPLRAEFPAELMQPDAAVQAAHERYRLALVELHAAGELLDRMHQPVMPRPVAIVQELVALRYHVRLDELWGPSRVARISAPRMTAMYLMRVLCGLLPGEVAVFFNRDRTTVSYAEHVVGCRLDTEKKFRAEMVQLITDCRAAIASDTTPETPTP